MNYIDRHVYMEINVSVTNNCVCLQNLRALENSLEKTQFKCKEAENIMTNYLKLKSHLQVCPINTFLGN